jgi:hypothetical protein
MEEDTTMTDQFKNNCQKHGIPTKTITTHVTIDVYNYLNNMAKENERSIPELLRDMIDFIIENDTT